MRVAALQRTADDDVHILLSNVCEGFVEIEVIAGQKTEPDAFQLQHIRLGVFKGVCAVQL